MSYGLRNTLILLVVLLVIVGGGGSYIYFWQDSTVESLTQELEQKQNTLQQKNQTASHYGRLQERFRKARRILNNLSKTLNDYENPNEVYDYLDEINRGVADINLNYSFRDTVINERYGIVRTSIQGYGEYTNLNNFVMNIENNRPLHKVRSLNISPNGETESETDVSFSFILESFFSKDSLFKDRSFTLVRNDYQIQHNPFFPLIRDIPSNEKGLPNIEQSRLAGISPNTIFLIDQNSNLHRMHVGDRVFLGRLTDINFKERSATFTLNKGGLVKEITMEVTE